VAGTSASGGRNAKSKAAHERAGTARKDRHAHTTPEAPSGRPLKPGYLSAVASAMWDELVAIMEREQRLTLSDGPYLEDASECYAEYVRWRVKAQADPLTQTKVTVDSAGNEHRVEQVHPSQQQYRLASETWRKKMVEGGITPIARSRVKLPEQVEVEDEFESHQKARANVAQFSRVK
jgi:phage terminase small subunit